MFFQFLKEQFTNIFSIAKPAFDILNERLDTAASGGIKVPTPPLIILVKHYGRFEAAVLCAVVENVARLVLIHKHGLQGAVERTLPILGSRVQSTFFAAYVFLANYFLFLITRAINRFHHTAVGQVALRIKNPALKIVFAIHLIFRMLFGEEYLPATIDYCKNLPVCVFNRIKGEVMTRVYIPWKTRVKDMQKSSAFFAFVCKRAFEFGVFTILAISVVFAFLSVYALDESSLAGFISTERGQAFIDDVQEDVKWSRADTVASNPNVDGNRIMGANLVGTLDDKIGDDAVQENPKLDDDEEVVKEEWEWEEAGSEHGGVTEGEEVVFEQSLLYIDTEEPTQDGDVEAMEKGQEVELRQEEEKRKKDQQTADERIQEEGHANGKQYDEETFSDSDSVFDSENISMEFGENLLDVDISEVLSLSNHISEDDLQEEFTFDYEKDMRRNTISTSISSLSIISSTIEDGNAGNIMTIETPSIIINIISSTSVSSSFFADHYELSPEEVNEDDDNEFVDEADYTEEICEDDAVEREEELDSIDGAVEECDIAEVNGAFPDVILETSKDIFAGKIDTFTTTNPAECDTDAMIEADLTKALFTNEVVLGCGVNTVEPVVDDDLAAFQSFIPDASMYVRQSFGSFVGFSGMTDVEATGNVVMNEQLEGSSGSFREETYTNPLETTATDLCAHSGESAVDDSQINSPVPDGTLVGVGLAREGYIFSDSQDLTYIEEMEALKRRCIRLGKKMSQYEYLEDIGHPEDVALIGISENGLGMREICNVGVKSYKTLSRRYSHSKSHSLDALTGNKSTHPKDQGSRMPSSTSRHSPPFPDSKHGTRVDGSPIAFDVSRRPLQKASRRSRQLSLMGIPHSAF